MGKADFQLHGAKELDKKLRSLGEKVHRRVTRQAVTAAATPVVKAAKANVAVDSGLAKKAMAKKVSTDKKTMAVSARIGAKRSVSGEVNGKTRKPSRYIHLIEKGYIDANGNHVPPQPFLQPAVQQSGEQAMTVMQAKLAAGIEREAAKAAS